MRSMEATSAPSAAARDAALPECAVPSSARPYSVFCKGPRPLCTVLDTTHRVEVTGALLNAITEVTSPGAHIGRFRLSVGYHEFLPRALPRSRLDDAAWHKDRWPLRTSRRTWPGRDGHRVQGP